MTNVCSTTSWCRSFVPLHLSSLCCLQAEHGLIYRIHFVSFIHMSFCFLAEQVPLFFSNIYPRQVKFFCHLPSSLLLIFRYVIRKGSKSILIDSGTYPTCAQKAAFIRHGLCQIEFLLRKYVVVLLEGVEARLLCELRCFLNYTHQAVLLNLPQVSCFQSQCWEIYLIPKL